MGTNLRSWNNYLSALADEICQYCRAKNAYRSQASFKISAAAAIAGCLAGAVAFDTSFKAKETRIDGSDKYGFTGGGEAELTVHRPSAVSASPLDSAAAKLSAEREADRDSQLDQAEKVDRELRHQAFHTHGPETEAAAEFGSIFKIFLLFTALLYSAKLDRTGKLRSGSMTSGNVFEYRYAG